MRPRILIALATAVVLTACGHIDTAPKVDVLPAAQPMALDYPQARQPAAPTAATGSLFHAATYRPGFEDRRARMVGDVLTVQIVENITASQKSSSTIDRDGSQKAGITALPFFGAASLAAKTTIAASSDTAFTGKGGTESANTFQGSITTTVMQVLPNGHLVVAGEKQIGVNQNVDVLRFSGIVDPRAIQPGSLVASSQVANARISSRGRGAQDEAQTIGWLSRFFLSVSPF
jgi:flagellar L-ring protein precursor FlgH